MSRGSGAAVALRWQWLNWPGRLRRAAAAGYLAVLTALLLAPSETIGGVDLFPYEDKVEHGLAFLGLASAVRWAASESVQRGGGALLLAVALAAYAAGMEALQPLLTGGDRQFEWLDMACNFAGLAIGWPLLAAVQAREEAATTTEGRVR